MSPSLMISKAEEPLPNCMPHLMPFHIDYSGPAPISTYFRVKPASPPSYLGSTENQGSDAQASREDTQNTNESQASSTSEATLVASSGNGTLDSPLGESSQDTVVDNANVKTHESGDRFVAAFRGRTVQGLTVKLPEGYAGVVLQTPNSSTDARAAKRSGVSATAPGRPRSTRSTRHSSQREAMDIGTDAGGGAAGDSDEGESEGALRALRPISTFSSFVLWNQDIPVDEGKDEYLRSLREWTGLAAEVHRVEND